MKKPVVAALAALALAAPLAAFASKHEKGAHHAGAGMTEGEVRKVDADAKKITIKHGPIPSLDMPAMTMVFRVKDPAMLERVKAGSKIHFQAEKIGGAYTVTELEEAR